MLLPSPPVSLAQARDSLAPSAFRHLSLPPSAPPRGAIQGARGSLPPSAIVRGAKEGALPLTHPSSSDGKGIIYLLTDDLPPESLKRSYVYTVRVRKLN